MLVAVGCCHTILSHREEWSSRAVVQAVSQCGVGTECRRECEVFTGSVQAGGAYVVGCLNSGEEV